MFRFYCMLIGYAFGCLQWAYIITKLRSKQDIRELGSGNSGTMNVTESLGKGFGLITLSLDGLKTFGAIGVCLLLFQRDRALLVAYAGFGAVLGHNFPFWMHFRGGKGVAVTLAMLLVLDWKALGILFITAALVYLACRRLVMCTMTLAMSAPFLLWAHRFPWEVLGLMMVLSFVMLYLHRMELRDPRKVIQDKEKRGELMILRDDAVQKHK